MGYLCADFSLPRPVLDLGPMYATDRQTSDVHHRLMPYGGGGITIVNNHTRNPSSHSTITNNFRFLVKWPIFHRLFQVRSGPPIIFHRTTSEDYWCDCLPAVCTNQQCQKGNLASKKITSGIPGGSGLRNPLTFKLNTN